MHICPRVMELLKEKGLDDVLVVIGGIIPDVDIPKLRDVGIKGVFLPGSSDAGHRRLHHRERQATRGAGLMPHKLLLADDSVTIQRVIELTFADEDVRCSPLATGRRRSRAFSPIVRTSFLPMSACRSVTATKWRRLSRETRSSPTFPFSC